MKPRILLVDDEPAIADWLRIVLEGEGNDTRLPSAWSADPKYRLASSRFTTTTSALPATPSRPSGR